MERRRADTNVTRELLDTIGGAIVGGDYEIGETLPTEASISHRYSASRTVTREAIKMLTAKGLVRSWPRRGTIVQHERQWNLLDPDVLAWTLDRRASIPLLKDFLVMRLAIEPAAASMAAESKADTTEIETALEFMKRANDGIGDPLVADSAFHAAVLRASGNRFFAQMAPLVDTALRMSIRLTNKLKGVRAASVDDHESILIAIQRNRKQRAFRETKAMIEEALKLVQTQLGSQPKPSINSLADGLETQTT